MQTQVQGLIQGAAVPILVIALQAVCLPTHVLLAHAILRHDGGLFAAMTMRTVGGIGSFLPREWANHAHPARQGPHLLALLGIYMFNVQNLRHRQCQDSGQVRLQDKMAGVPRNSETGILYPAQ